MLIIHLNPIKINGAKVRIITRLHPSIMDVKINVMDEAESFLF